MPTSSTGAEPSALQYHLTVFWRAQSRSHVEALKELLTVTAITAAPFLLGAVAFLLAPGPHDVVRGGEHIKNLSYYCSVLFLRGQLFLIATSYLATALYRLWNASGTYFRPDVINLFSLLLFGTIGIFYGFNPTFAELDSTIARDLSILALAMSFFFYYYLAVLASEKPPEPEKVLRRQAKSTTERLLRRRQELGE